MTADLLGWSSPMTDTHELPAIYVGVPLEDAPTMALNTEPIPFPWTLPPVPAPVRLPKRIRRRVGSLFGGRS